jgi:hypothetical protein
MLHEAERAAGPQHPDDLGQGAVRVRDCAQRPGTQHVVDACVAGGQHLGVGADVLDRHGARGGSSRGQLAARGGRVNGPDPLDPGRVVRDVQARPETDLQHLALQPGRDPGPRARELTPAQGQVDGPGKDLICVQAHAASVTWPAASTSRYLPPSSPGGSSSTGPGTAAPGRLCEQCCGELPCFSYSGEGDLPSRLRTWLHRVVVGPRQRRGRLCYPRAALGTAAEHEVPVQGRAQTVGEISGVRRYRARGRK